MTPEWLLLVFAALLAAAAAQDMWTFRISNLFPLAVLLLFGAYVVIAGVPDNWWENLLHFSVALIAGMILFSLGWFGGGDAKLYASCALWFDLAAAIPLLLFVSLSGVILLVLMLVKRRMRKARASANALDPDSTKKKSLQMPYGVAISAGAIAALYFVGVNPQSRPAFDPMAVPMPEDLRDLTQ